MQLKEAVAVEVLTGSGNWKLTLRREDGGVTVLRAATCDAAAVLPGELLGLPVLALGDRAFAPGAKDVPGEELTLRGLPAEAEWDNRSLRELTLPPSLSRVGDYALMNCAALEVLRLTDNPMTWGTGALMNCRALGRFFLERGQGDAAAYFAGELQRELDISVSEKGETRLRLIFPEYFESYEENSPAHHFDYKVFGAGQPYHHAFRQRRLSLYDYDALWQRYLSGEYEADTALRLAWYRLCWPEGLSPAAEEGYRTYLESQAAEGLALNLGDRSLLRRFLDLVPCSDEALRAASARARESGNTAASAILLDELHRRGTRSGRWTL